MRLPLARSNSPTSTWCHQRSRLPEVPGTIWRRKYIVNEIVSTAAIALLRLMVRTRGGCLVSSDVAPPHGSNCLQIPRSIPTATVRRSLVPQTFFAVGFIRHLAAEAFIYVVQDSRPLKISCQLVIRHTTYA